MERASPLKPGQQMNGKRRLSLCPSASFSISSLCFLICLNDCRFYLFDVAFCRSLRFLFALLFDLFYHLLFLPFCFCFLPLLDPLGLSWAAFGRSWPLLGRSLNDMPKIIKKSMPKMTDLGSQKGAKREPKTTPKRTKIEDKNPCEKRTDIRPS